MYFFPCFALARRPHRFVIAEKETLVSQRTKIRSDLVADVFYDTILPLNGALICLFVVYQWKKKNFDIELEQGDAAYKGTWMEKYINFALGTFIPILLILVFINTVALKFFNHSFI